MATLLTARHALPSPDGTELVKEGNDAVTALAEALDAIIAIADKGTLAARPTSTPGSPGKVGRFYYATDLPQLFFDHGTGWTEAGPPPVVTAMPGTPYDGQTVILQTAAMAAVGAAWTLRYRAGASGSYKWDVLAAAPLLASLDAINTAASAVADLTLDVPVAGDYIIDSGIRAQRTAADFSCELLIKAPGGSTVTDQAWLTATSITAGTPRVTGSGTCRKTLTASGTYTGDTVNLNGDPSVIAAWMKFTPIRVG